MKKCLVLSSIVVVLLSCIFLSSCSTPQEEEFQFELLENNTYTLQKYNGQESIVTIPDTYKGKAVTAISSSALSYANISEIHIPEGIESVGSNAFDTCQSLTKVFLPSSIKYIYSNAFASCTALSEIHFGGTVEDWCNIEYGNSISFYDGANANPLMYGAQLFIGGERLEELIVPETCVRINPFAFCGYKYLRTVTFSCQSSIGEYAFYECTALYDIQFPSDSTMDIREYAFFRCTNLTSIFIPRGISEIHETAFEECWKLIQVNNESPNVENIFGDYKEAGWFPLHYNQGNVIDNVNGFLFVTYNQPDGAQYYLIGYHGEAEFLDFPADYNGKDYLIYLRAFSNNPYIENVNISAGVTELMFYSFAGCSNLKNVTFDPDSRLWRIYAHTFEGCINLENIVIPSSDVEVDYFAFEGCNSIKGNTYGNALYISTQDNPYFILLRALDKNITYCEINNRCKTIHSNAFKDCTALKTISFGSNVVEIGAYAFRNSGLETVTLPESVTDICFCAFENCKNLTQIQLPRNLHSIHQYLFQGCNSLEKITILNPELVAINGDALDECSSLSAIYFNGTVNQWLSLAFENPYCNAPNWGEQVGEYTVYCTDGTVNINGELISS